VCLVLLLTLHYKRSPHSEGGCASSGVGAEVFGRNFDTLYTVHCD
jgi:hypothetical protein